MFWTLIYLSGVLITIVAIKLFPNLPMFFFTTRWEKNGVMVDNPFERAGLGTIVFWPLALLFAAIGYGYRGLLVIHAVVDIWLAPKSEKDKNVRIS